MTTRDSAEIKERPLTPGALTTALTGAFPGVEVAEVRVLERSTGTNSNARIGLTYRHREGAPETLFVKLPSTGATQRELVRKSGMSERELGFYRDVARDVSLRVPGVYGTEFDRETGDFAMLLEDVVTTGCRFLSPAEKISFETARGAVEDLADLHLTHRTNDALRERTRWVGPQIRLREYGAGMLGLALEHCRAGLTDEFARIAQFYIDHHDAVQDEWDKGAWSIVHGDCHWGNLFLDGERIGFFDWGCMAYMPGMRDVGYFLCMGLSVDDRRRYERDLIQVYLDRIAAGGGPPMGMDEAWEMHRLHAAYAVPASAPASIYGLLKDKVEFDPEFVAEFLVRSSAAIADLDAYDALSTRVLSAPEGP
ncbi:MAG: aminoglycoside phosphotransferase family protein [Candidatus Binatia bacterium]|nr:aminoglycoside phosphotransferase family protein [Candidatus Binatia bacterium]